MRVAHLLGSLNRGGAEMLVLNIFRKKKKIDTVKLVLFHRKKGSIYNDFMNIQCPIYEVKPKSKFDVFYPIRLRKALLEEKIQIIHTHQVIDTIIGVIATIGTNIKIIFTVHGHGLNDNYFQSKLRNLALNKSNLNLFVSESLRSFYVKKYIICSLESNQTLYNGIAFDNIGPLKFQSSRIMFRENCLTLGMVGNFTSVRDHITICHFLLLLDTRNIDFDFVFIGSKSNAESHLYDNCIKICSSLIQKGKVRFLGSRGDVLEILPKLDAFIYASAHDTFGIAVVEAMSAGVPVFVNDWEVMCEITNNGQWATLYQSKNTEDLLFKFSDFINNTSKFKTNASLNAPSIKKKYSIEEHLNKLTKIYQTILKK